MSRPVAVEKTFAMDIEKLKQRVLAEAEARRESAGFNGSHHDGGASVLEMQVEFYTLGQQGKIPHTWKKFEQEFDPEWEEYQRLKNKFEVR